MSTSEHSHPLNLVVLTSADEPLPPGLDALPETVRLVHAADEDTLAQSLREADILLVTDFRTELLRRHWAQAQRLRWIHATSAGVDALMFDELVQSNVVVTNARGIFDDAISEFVLGQILMFAKDFHGSFRYQQQRHWQHRESERLENRKVMVVGAGAIGRAIGRRLQANDMQVLGIASRSREDPVFGTVAGQDALPELLPAADFVVIAAPLTEQTRGLFNSRLLACMAPHSRLINIGRGPIVVTDALLEALRSEQIAGAALDVFEQEPLPPQHPLWELPNVILSPHMAGDFIGWQEALTGQFLDNLARWQDAAPLFNQVDKRRGYGAS